ncbi:MAG: FUSC family protein [Terriglobia bacterium]|jgi:hypothetical protein
MAKPRKRKWKWPHVQARDLVHTLRTAVAAVGSVLIARLLRLPESYWAAITTMVVMQSTLGAERSPSRANALWERRWAPRWGPCLQPSRGKPFPCTARASSCAE